MGYDLAARRIASEQPIKWFGDLRDDCTALWAGFMLRAEKMDEDSWYWGVYDQETKALIDASFEHEKGNTWKTGDEARVAAENAAKCFLQKLL